MAKSKAYHNGQHSANPIVADFDVLQEGLTKREYFAGLAMQNIINRYNPWEDGDFDSSEYEICAENAVGLADALLKELSK